MGLCVSLTRLEHDRTSLSATMRSPRLGIGSRRTATIFIAYALMGEISADADGVAWTGKTLRLLAWEE
jgi:hypothetical protein